MSAPAVPIGVTAVKPIERHGMDAFSHFMFEPSTGAIMGRTPMSWALITVFYLIYYTLLAAFWTLCIFIFFQTIDEFQPRWTVSESIIGNSPALGVRPGQTWELIDSSMINFNKDVKKSTKENVGWGEWANRSREFLEPYHTSTLGKECAAGDKAPTFGNDFCKFIPDKKSPCFSGNYGYNQGKPCVFIKLNKIYGLVPDYHNDTSALPKEVPAEAAERIEKAGNKNQVWIDCHGEQPADIESMGPITYYPSDAGFDSSYFPYLNQNGYLSPLIAVQFENPAVGQLLHIECRAYAKNIGYHKRDKIGRAHFEILVRDSNQIEIN